MTCHAVHSAERRKEGSRLLVRSCLAPHALLPRLGRPRQRLLSPLSLPPSFTPTTQSPPFTCHPPRLNGATRLHLALAFAHGLGRVSDCHACEAWASRRRLELPSPAFSKLVSDRPRTLGDMQIAPHPKKHRVSALGALVAARSLARAAAVGCAVGMIHPANQFHSQSWPPCCCAPREEQHHAMVLPRFFASNSAAPTPPVVCCTKEAL